MKQIYVNCKFTQKQYRDYLNFHVLGNKPAMRRHIFISVLILLFGLANFRAGSPILGWIFVPVGIYVLLSRFVWLFINGSRVIKQYGLSDTPKFFYAVSFTGEEKGLHIKNTSKKVHYAWSQIWHVCVREKQQIIYLYLTKSKAFLLPFECFEKGTPQELLALISEKCGGNKITHFSV